MASCPPSCLLELFPGVKPRVELVNIGFMVAYSAPTTPMRFGVARVTDVTTTQAHAFEVFANRHLFAESKEEVVLTAMDIMAFQSARNCKTLKVPDGQIKKLDLNIIQWDMRMQGVFCLPVVWVVYLSGRQTWVACSACCCIEAATPAPHEPAAQSAPTSAGTRPIIPTDSSPAPPPKSDIPAWLQEAKDS